MGSGGSLLPPRPRGGGVVWQPHSPVGVSDAGMQNVGPARAPHVSVGNCVSTSVSLCQETVSACLWAGYEKATGSRRSRLVSDEFFGVDYRSRAADDLELIESILTSFALVFVARRSFQTPLFTNKEYGRFVGSLRQTAVTLATYQLAGALKGGVKYHLDVLLAKAFFDTQPVPKPGIVTDNLFKGWLGVAVKRALHRRDISFIYSLTKGSPQAWPGADDGELIKAFEKHRRLLGADKDCPPESLLTTIRHLMETKFPNHSSDPSRGSQFYTGDDSEVVAVDPKLVEYSSTASKFCPTGRACRQMSRKGGGGLRLVPALTGVDFKESTLRNIQERLVDWRERAYDTSRTQFECGVHVRTKRLTKKSEEAFHEASLAFHDKVEAGVVPKDRFGRLIIPVEVRASLEAARVRVDSTSRKTLFAPSWQQVHWDEWQEDGTFVPRVTYAMNDVSAIALKEAGLKVRVITLGDGPTNALLQPVQGHLLDCWKKTPWNTMAPEDADLLSRVRQLSLAFKADLENEDYDGGGEEGYYRSLFGSSGTDPVHWMSGDFEAATDNLKSEATLAAASMVGGPYGDLLMASFAPGRISYTLPLTDPKELPPPVYQKSGQLMGHPCSFPLLCVINTATVLEALTIWLDEVGDWRIDPGFTAFMGKTVGERTSFPGGKEWRARARFRKFLTNRFLINGDDVLALMPPSLYRIWREVTTSVGLIPSKGKNFFSKDVVQINSQVFKIHPDGEVTRVWYLNQRLVTGVSVKNGDVIASPSETIREFNKITKNVPWTSSVLPMVASRWMSELWFPKVNGRKVVPNWYLPVHLGGWGADPSSGPADVRVSPGQRRLAAIFASQTGIPLVLYKVLKGFRSKPACELATRIGLVRLRYGDYVPTATEDLVRDTDSGWFGRLTLVSRAQSTNQPMSDSKLVATVIPENYHAKPMSLAGIAAHWNVQVFTNSSLPPVPPLPPAALRFERGVELGERLLTQVLFTRFSHGSSSIRNATRTRLLTTQRGLEFLSGSPPKDLIEPPRPILAYPVWISSELDALSDPSFFDLQKLQLRSTKVKFCVEEGPSPMALRH